MCNEIRIYITDLAAYNAGYLHGAWIDATQELEDIQTEVHKILDSSPMDDAEEYAIHDYEELGGANELACFIGAYLRPRTPKRVSPPSPHSDNSTLNQQRPD